MKNDQKNVLAQIDRAIASSNSVLSKTPTDTAVRTLLETLVRIRDNVVDHWPLTAVEKSRINIGIFSIRELEGVHDGLVEILTKLDTALVRPTITYSGNTLVVNSEASQQFHMSAPIISALDDQVTHRIFVLLESATEPNLLCIDAQNGAVLWSARADQSRSKDNIFTNIRLDDDINSLIAFDWDGYRSRFELSTGQLTESHFVK